MRKILFLFLAARVFTVNAQLLPDNVEEEDLQGTYTERIDEVLENLDKSEITSGYLMDRGIVLENYTLYNGSHKAPAATFEAWQKLYATAYGAALSPSLQLPEPYDSYLKEDKDPNTIQITGLALHYHRFDSLAVQKNLIYVLNNQLYDVVGRTESPYLPGVLFAFATDINYTDSLHNTFIFNSDTWFGNMAENISQLTINFDDGLGNRPLLLNQPISIQYPFAGEKNITVTTTLSTGEVKTAHIFFKVNYPAPQPRYENIPDDIQYITATKSFNHVTAGLTLNIAYGCGKTQLTKPLVVVEAFNPGIGEWWPDMEYINYRNKLNNTAGLLKSSLEENDFDLVYVDFDDGGTWLQANAYALQEALNWLNQELQNNNSTEQIVMIGESMGGLIGRYALADMENNNQVHNVRKLITFDSPHQGANIPIGLQYMLKHLANVKLFTAGPKLKYIVQQNGAYPLLEAENVLLTPAAMQMLCYHAYSEAESIRLQFIDDYASVGVPQQCENIAVSNGSYETNGQVNSDNVRIEPGDKILDIKQHNFTVLPWFLAHILVSVGTGFYVDLDVWALPEYSSDKFKCYSGTVLSGFLFAPVIVSHKAVRVKNLKPLDTAPGGTDGADVPPPAGIGGNFYWAGNFCFIPSTSSLDIYPAVWGNDPYYNIGLNNPNTLFDRYIAVPNVAQLEEQNEFHINFTANNVGFFADEIIGYRLAGGFLNDGFNFGKNNNIYTGTSISNGVTIENELCINCNAAIGYQADNNPPPANNSTFEVDVRGTDCGEAIVRVNSQGSLIVGSNNSNRRGVLRFEEGSSLIVNSGGSLIVNNNSTLVIEQGALLRINNGGAINLIGSNAKIEIKGTLELGSGAIITPMGNGVIVFDGGLISLPSSGSNLVLGKNGNNDVKILVAENTNLRVSGSAGALITISNTTVRMGVNSGIDFGAVGMNLSSANFWGTSSAYFNGLILNGQLNHTLYDLDIRYAKTGIKAYQNLNSNAVLNLNEVTIRNCQNVGLHVIGSGVNLQKVYISEIPSGVGYKHELATKSGNITDSEINLCDKGIWYNANNNAPLLVDNCYIHGNNRGVEITGAAVMNASCGSIVNNTQYGILVGLNSTLENVNDVNVKNNHISIGLSSAYKLDLENGYSDYVPQTEAVGRVIRGSMRKTIACYQDNTDLDYPLKANYNRWWITSGSSQYGKQIRQLTDYIVTDANGALMTISGRSAAPNVCGVQPPPTGCNPCEISLLNNCNNCEEIITSHFNGVKMNLAMKDAIQTMERYNSASGNDLLAIEKFNEVLTFSYKHINTNERAILDYGYERIKETFGSALKSGKISSIEHDNRPELNLHAQMVLDVIQKWIDGTDGGGVEGPTKLDPCNPLAERPANDKGSLFKALGRDDNAKEIFEDVALNNPEPKVAEMAHYWMCLAEKDDMLKRGSISEQEYKSIILECSNILILNNSDSDANDGIITPPASNSLYASNLRLLPNPTTGVVNVYFQSEENTLYTMEISDLTGRKIMGVEGEAKLGANNLYIDLSKHPKGVYYVRLLSNGNQYVEKILLSK